MSNYRNDEPWYAARRIAHNLQEDIGITIFPAPASDGILTIISASKRLGRIEIYNMAGQKVLTADGQGTFSKQIDVTQLRTGIYYIKLEEIGQSKFIIKKMLLLG